MALSFTTRNNLYGVSGILFWLGFPFLAVFTLLEF